VATSRSCLRARAADRARGPDADELTRGIDVGAKRDIYEVLVRLASDDGILLISNELEEIRTGPRAGDATGRLVAELSGPT
jgi:hypothetical protein